MATSIIETSERSQAGMEIQETPQWEESPTAKTTGITFTDEQRKILAQAYQLILSWAKPQPELQAPVGADAISLAAVEMES